MAKKKTIPRFLLCVKNDIYPVSLEMRKVYQAIPDEDAAARHFVRVIDESGEDYLYPESYFVAVDLPRTAVSAFTHAS
jgi:hypothetical protein